MSLKTFTILYSCIVLSELFFKYNVTFSQFSYLTKPAIVGSLIIYFLSRTKGQEKSTRNLILLALLGSIIGDILLMFVSQSSNFFIAGLISFLMAHVMYTLVFLKRFDAKKKPYLFIGALLVYSIGLFYFLKEGLGTMLFPVIIYITAILSMAIAAFLREGHFRSTSYLWVFMGALIFIISDSIIAIDKFHKPFALSGVAIMFTYAVAQYLIVLGILKQKQ